MLCGDERSVVAGHGLPLLAVCNDGINLCPSPAQYRFAENFNAVCSVASTEVCEWWAHFATSVHDPRSEGPTSAFVHPRWPQRDSRCPSRLSKLPRSSRPPVARVLGLPLTAVCNDIGPLSPACPVLRRAGYPYVLLATPTSAWQRWSYCNDYCYKAGT
jgi:hypothetical protein